jgi:hypothetical protein
MKESVRHLRQAMVVPITMSSNASIVQRKCACGGTPGPTGECEACCQKKLQRAANHPSSLIPHPSEVPPIVQEVLRSPGHPIDPTTRAFMEPRFGHDFSHVRLHTDARAEESTRAVNALAYTVGHHIAFDTGGYAPQTLRGSNLLAHELAHILQQSTEGSSSLRLLDSPEHEREADAAAEAIHFRGTIPAFHLLPPGAVTRQKLLPDEPLTIDRTFELDPHMFLRPMESRAEKEVEKCEEFPGGSTDCEVDEKTGTPTGKVKQRVDETNPCTRPCVEKHEAVHVKQMKKFCPELRDCYLAADKGRRPASDCAKMAIFGNKERECEAYKVSVPCVEERIKNAKECHTKDNKDYGARKLASEKCFRNKYCGS